MQDLQLVSAERERLPDQPLVVGVEDLAGRRPDLDADDRIVQHALAHRGVDSCERRGVTRQNPVAEQRRDDALAGDPGQHLGIADGLTLAGAADVDDARHAEHGEHDEAADHERGNARATPPLRRQALQALCDPLHELRAA